MPIVLTCDIRAVSHPKLRHAANDRYSIQYNMLAYDILRRLELEQECLQESADSKAKLQSAHAVKRLRAAATLKMVEAQNHSNGRKESPFSQEGMLLSGLQRGAGTNMKLLSRNSAVPSR